MVTTSLETLLNDCERLLAQVGERFWAEKISHVVSNMAERWTASDVEEVLSWFGGMGSLNDLVISTQNAHTVCPEEENGINKQLEDYRDRIYEVAADLKRTIA